MPRLVREQPVQAGQDRYPGDTLVKKEGTCLSFSPNRIRCKARIPVMS